MIESRRSACRGRHRRHETPIKKCLKRVFRPIRIGLAMGAVFIGCGGAYAQAPFDLDALAKNNFSIAYLIYLSIATGAVGMAVGFMVYILRNKFLEQEVAQNLRRRLMETEGKLHWANSIVEASPAVLLVWEGDELTSGEADLGARNGDANGSGSDSGLPAAEGRRQGPTAKRARLSQSLGRPKILGSPSALGHLLGASSPTRWASGRDQSIFDSFLHGLREEDRDQMAAAIETLKESGTAFHFSVFTEKGFGFHTEGRTVGGKAVVWLRDVSAEIREINRLKVEIQRAEQERNALAGILERAPIPI